MKQPEVYINDENRDDRGCARCGMELRVGDRVLADPEHGHAKAHEACHLRTVCCDHCGLGIEWTADGFPGNEGWRHVITKATGCQPLHAKPASTDLHTMERHTALLRKPLPMTKEPTSAQPSLPLDRLRGVPVTGSEVRSAFLATIAAYDAMPYPLNARPKEVAADLHALLRLYDNASDGSIRGSSEFDVMRQSSAPAWTRQHIKQDAKTSLWRAWCDCGWERTNLGLIEDKFSIVDAFRDHGREGCR